ncbi:MAG: DUF7289 family protein [Halococcoides sp.]
MNPCRRTRSLRGQASVLGIVALFALMLASATIVAAVGATAITESHDQSADQQATREMQSLQTQIGEAAAGQPRGSFDGASTEEMHVAPERGWIRVTHHDYSGSGATEVVANESLGEVIYERGETTLAYQAGGLWRLKDDGTSKMVAKPALEYRDATMTVPMLSVEEGSLQSSSAVAFEKTSERRVFPNETGPTAGDEVGAPYDETDESYTNPMYNGSLTVTVQSRFDDAWAEYFRSSTGGTVTRTPTENLVHLTMETPSRPVGDFDMPLEGDGIRMDGLSDEHPLEEYTLELQPDGHFGNLHWGMYVDSPDEKFEIHFQSTKPGKCKSGNFEGDLYMSVFYANATTHEEWHTKAIDPDTHDDFSINCSSRTLTLNALADEDLYYKNIENIPGTSSAGNKWVFGDEITDTYITGPTTSFEAHDVDRGQYDRGDKERAEFVVNHYFGLLNGSTNLTVTDGPGTSSRVDEAASRGRIYYPIETGPQFLQYLHVTDREVVVDVRG